MGAAKCRGTVLDIDGDSVSIYIDSGPVVLRQAVLVTSMNRARAATMTGKRRGSLSWGDARVQRPLKGEVVHCTVIQNGEGHTIDKWAPVSAITRIKKVTKSRGRQGGTVHSHAAASARLRKPDWLT